MAGGGRKGKKRGREKGEKRRKKKKKIGRRGSTPAHIIGLVLEIEARKSVRFQPGLREKKKEGKKSENLTKRLFGRSTINLEAAPSHSGPCQEEEGSRKKKKS